MAGPKPKLIVIGDVHGCAEELKALIHKLPLDQDTTILFLGDYVDRGPDAKGVIDTVLDLTELYKVIALQGNHEWLMQQYLANPQNAVASGNFILNGGSATLASYSQDGSTYTIPSSHRKFLDELKLFHSTETHFYVHAGIPPDFDFSPKVDAKTAHQFLWIRNVFLDSRVKWPKVIVHGHTPVSQPEILPNRINLDTGCVFGRRLTAMNMDTGEIYSVERNQVAPTFLKHTAGAGGARAVRFHGEMAVELRVDGGLYPFRTVNFNEFGLLLYPAPGAKRMVQLSLGQAVEGQIQPGADLAFRFKASVVRKDLVKNLPHYGLRFDELENLAELP
jgi:serine/threonine protein phosphatase 1